MSSTPRIIATTASVALLAATGAGVAVMALDTVTADSGQVAADATTSADTVPAPQDDRLTVYKSPSDDHEDDDDYDDDDAPTSTQQLQPAPPSTSFHGNNGGQTQSNTSKSS